MHGNRHEHPAVFTARMQMHKYLKKQHGDDAKGKTPDKLSKDDKDDAPPKRPAPFQRKGSPPPSSQDKPTSSSPAC